MIDRILSQQVSQLKVINQLCWSQNFSKCKKDNVVLCKSNQIKLVFPTKEEAKQCVKIKQMLRNTLKIFGFEEKVRKKDLGHNWLNLRGRLSS